MPRPRVNVIVFPSGGVPARPPAGVDLAALDAAVARVLGA